MNENKPTRPSKRRQQSLIHTQSKFWDYINSIELPIIIFIQKNFKAYKMTSFWNSIAILASPRTTRYLPILLYSIGLEAKSKHLALSLVYFALFSSFGKYLINRRRPGSYEGVHSLSCSSTSSFPSRHTISVTIVSYFLPLPYVWITLIIMSRIMLGMHFITDCILAIFVGKFALLISQLITDPNFCLFIFLVTFRIWGGCYKVLCGSLPILIISSPALACASFANSPLCFPLVFLCKFFRKFLPPEKSKPKKSEVNSCSDKKSASHSKSSSSSKKSLLPSSELLVIELIPISLCVFIICVLNRVLFCIREIDFDNDLCTLNTSCCLCSSSAINSGLSFILKFSFGRKLLSAIKYTDLLSFELRDKILYILYYPPTLLFKKLFNKNQ